MIAAGDPPWTPAPQQLRVRAVTWNVGDLVQGDFYAPGMLLPLLLGDASSGVDILAVGLQEIEMSAGAFFSAGVSYAETGKGQKWSAAIARALEGHGFEKIVSCQLLGMQLLLFCRTPLAGAIVPDSLQLGCVSCGLMGVAFNKGALAARLELGGQSWVFLTCHLAHGQNKVAERNADWAKIASTLQFQSASGTALGMDADCVVVMGDLNYRIDSREDLRVLFEPLLSGRATDVSPLAVDQLGKERDAGRTLVGFEELPVDFAPSYKYDPHTDTFDTSKKQREPAWCDRILWKQRQQQVGAGKGGAGSGVSITPVPGSYRPYPVLKASDHKPVVLELLVWQASPLTAGSTRTRSPPVRGGGSFVRAVAKCAAIPVAAFLYCVGVGCTNPTVAELLLQRACLREGQVYPSQACTGSSDAQAEASRHLSYFNLCCSLPAAMTVAFVSMLADSIGRKQAVIVPLLGNMLSALALAALPATPQMCIGGAGAGLASESGSGSISAGFYAGSDSGDSQHHNMRAGDGYCVDSFLVLLLAVGLASFSGGYFAVLSASFAVIGDVTEGAPPQLRTYLFAVLETALMLGFFVGPAAGGEIARWLGLQRSMYFPVCCYAAGLLIIGLGFTETISDIQRVAFSWRKANPVGAMWMLADNRVAATLAAMVALQNFAGGAQSVLPLYLARVLGFDEVQNGWYQAAGTGGGAVGLLLVLPCLQRCCSLKVQIVLSVGCGVLAGFTGGLGAAALASSVWRRLPFAAAMPYLLASIGSVLTVIWYPCMRSVLTLKFGPSRFAMAIGAISTLQTFMNVIGPLAFAQGYAATERSSPPLAFFVAAGLNFLAFLLAITLPRLEVSRAGKPEVPNAEGHDRRQGGVPSRLPSLVSPPSSRIGQGLGAPLLQQEHGSPPVPEASSIQ